MAEKKIDAEIVNNDCKNRTVDDEHTESEQFSNDKREDMLRNAPSSSQRASEFRQTPKFNDLQSYVTQSHHSLGTGLFLTDEIHDLPPRFRNKVVRALETCAALNNIPLSVDPLTILSSVSADSDEKKDDSDPLVISSSASCKDEKHFESKRSLSRASSHESGNNTKKKVPSVSQSYHPNSSNEFRSKDSYKSVSQNSRTGNVIPEKHLNTENATVHKTGIQNQPIPPHQSKSSYSNTQLEASQLRYHSLNRFQNKGFQTQRTISKPTEVTSVPEQNQLQFKNKNSFRKNNSSSIANHKGSINQNHSSSNRQNSRIERTGKYSSENKPEQRSIFSELFPNFNPDDDSSTKDEMSKFVRDSTRSVYSQSSNNFHKIQKESCTNNKSFSRRNSCHSDESNFSIDSKIFMGNKTIRKSSEAVKRDALDNTFQNKRAYTKETDICNPSKVTPSHCSNAFSEPKNISHSTNHIVRNKSKNYGDSEINNDFNNSRSSRNNNTRSSDYENSYSNTNSKTVNSSKSDNNKTRLYNQKHTNMRFIDDKCGKNAKDSTLSKSCKDEDLSNNRVYNHHNNSSSKFTDAAKGRENFADTDVHSYNRNKREKACNKFHNPSIKEQNYYVDERNHRHNNYYSDVSSVKSDSSQNVSNFSSKNSSFDDLRKNKKSSTSEYRYPNSKKHYDVSSITSDTSVDVSSSGINSSNHCYSREKKEIKVSASNYSKLTKGPFEKFSVDGRSHSNSQSYKQSKPYSSNHIFGTESKNECVDHNENNIAKKFRHTNEHKSFENSRHVKSVKQNKENMKDDADKTLSSFTHKKDTEFKRTGCIECGFFLKIKVSEESTNLEYWLSYFKNIFSFPFDMERCCHFSDMLILSFEQKKDGLQGEQILFKERKKMLNSCKPHVISNSVLKYRLVKPCDCEQKVIPDCIASIEKNAQLSLDVIDDKMKKIEISTHGKENSEVVHTEMEMLRTFEDSKSNFINFKKEIISKIEATVNLNTAQRLKLSFLRESNMFKRCLPIYSRKDRILESVRFYSVTVIVAETGSGKSTQIAEYLLHSKFADYGIIICTQPRKLAAITIAQYVSSQVGSAVGKVVGYDIGTERKCSDATKIIYMTDYCLLKFYLRNKNFKDVSCIIIDEAHERSLYTDLLLGILKKCLPMRPSLRVIITSATINPSIFIDYFQINSKSVIEVPGRSYPVDVIWWPRNVELGWNYVEACVEKVYQIHTQQKEGDILVFLTSPGESDEAINLFKKHLKERDRKVQLFCLHGKSDIYEQMQIFQVSHTTRKIIFATNVAETAVTIPGIKYVVDSGMTKGLIFDPKKNKSVLAVNFINKSSAEQRKGRAGRTQSGVCYRMYSVRNFNQNMADNAVPDILRTNLQKALLKIFEFDIDPKEFNFIESPPDKTISNAVDSLEYLGAIENKKLTVLGKKLAKLPLEPQLAKLVLTGIEAGIGYEIITIAALVTEAGKLFIRNEDNKIKADERKKMFCQEGGDLCTYLEVYKRWKEVEFSRRFDWCNKNFVSSKALNAASKAIYEIINSLQTDLSISVSKKYKNIAFKQHYERVLFDSFSENLCVSSGHPKLGYLSPFLPESFYIHPSSTLSYLGKDTPEYLVYSTLMETSRNYLFDITPISEETIKLANQAGTFKIPLNSLKCLEVPPKVMGPFGESVLIRHVLGKQGSKIKDLEIKFKGITNTKNIQIDVEVDKGLITIYAGHRHHEKIAKEINEIIDKAHQEMLREEDVIKLAKTSVHYALGAGGIISDIIMPGEFRELVINNLTKRKCIEVQDLLENYGLLQSVNQTTCKQQIEIYATYRKVCDAQRAFLDLSEMKTLHVTPKLCLPNISNKSLPLFKLNVSWCRRPCTGKGWVQFDTEEDLVIASGILTHSSFSVSNNYILFTPSERCTRELRMIKLPKCTEENVIINNLKKYLPNDMCIKHVIIERTVLEVIEDHIKDAKKKLTQLVSCFIPTTKVVIDVKYPKRTDNFWEASIYFECFDDQENVFKKLQDNGTIDSYPLSVSQVFKSSLDCKKEVYAAVSYQIIAFLTHEQNIKFNEKVNIKVSESKVTVEFTCESIEQLTKTRQVLMYLLQGEVMDFIGKPKCHFLFSLGYTKQIKEIEKSTNTFIRLNSTRKTITIYGLTSNCKKAKEKIYSITSDSNLSNTRAFNLNDSCIPSGFLKNTYIKYGYNLHGLIDAFELTAAEIVTDKGILILRGPKDGITQAEKALETICEELYNSGSSKKKPNRTDEICPICLDPVSYAFHRLEHCGHAFCRECLLLQVESKSIPLVCAKQNCEKLIFLEDIKRIISFGGDHLRKSFAAVALQHYVSSNTAKISYCPTPDCQLIYRVTKQGSEYNCPGCKNSICTHCQTPYHYGMSCDMFQNCQKNEDYSLKVWVEEKESDRKYCPSCKAVIEKSDGCNHMECLNCKVHLCWLCLQVFRTGQMVYDHLPYCLKNQS